MAGRCAALKAGTVHGRGALVSAPNNRASMARRRLGGRGGRVKGGEVPSRFVVMVPAPRAASRSALSVERSASFLRCSNYAERKTLNAERAAQPPPHTNGRTFSPNSEICCGLLKLIAR